MTLGRASVFTLAAAVASACGAGDSSKDVKPDGGDGGLDAAPPEPSAEADGEAPPSPLPEAGSPPEDSAVPAPEAAAPDASVPEAGSPDVSTADAAGGPDASPDVSLPDASPDAAPDAAPDAQPEAGLCAADGGLVETVSCDVLQSGARFDPGRGVVILDPQGLFQLDGVPVPPTDYYFQQVEVEIRYTSQGSLRADYQSPAPKSVAGGLVELEFSMPAGVVTEVLVDIHRALAPDDSLRVGLAELTFVSPTTDGGTADGGAGDSGGAPWPATACLSLFGPAIVDDCSEVSTATYDPQTRELVLAAPFEVTSYSLREYGPSLSSSIDTPPTRVGDDLVWQLPENNRDELTLVIDGLLGPCETPYYGSTYVRILPPAPALQDGGAADAGDEGDAGDAAVQEFWSSSCDYEKFFQPEVFGG